MRYRFRAMLAAGAVVAVGAMVVAGGASAATFLGTNGDIAYTHETSTTGSDIFKHTTTGQLIQLTNDPGSESGPSWAGNGEFFAFTSFPDPPGSGFGSIETLRHDGTGRTVVVPGSITNNNFSPTVSPDGKKIAFSSENQNTNQTQIFIVNIDGTGLTPLTTGPEEAISPEFSPDGTKIAFDRINPVTGFIELLVMNADGSGLRTLFAPPNTDVTSPAWAPNGQSLVFEQFVSGAQFDIGRVNADGSNPTLLTNTPNEDEFEPKLSPDGLKLVYSQFPAGGNQSNLVQSDASGANPTPLTNEGTNNFNFSPDYQALNPPSDCDLTGKATSKSFSRINVTVTCPSENVTAALSGTGKAAKVPKGAVVSKKKKFEIPPVTAQVPEATPTNVSLKIPKKGKKALKKAAKAGKKGKATVTATLTDDLNQTASDTFKVTFKAKK